MPSNKKLLQAAAGNAGESLYVEDVFSTYLYDSTHGTSPIVNNINLADEGGMVWFKHRTSTYSNILFDTERGTSNHLVSNTTAANATSIGLSSFNTDGFSFSGVNLNVNSDSHVAWSFRKAEKFFDVVTYTGTGDAAPGQTVAHNLGSTPGFIIIKRTDSTSDWTCYHNGLTSSDYYLRLHNTSAETEDGSVFPSAPTDSNFYVRADRVNASGGTFVAYLFASDAGGYGDDDENIIKCGSYTADGSDKVISCGFEAQWILVKRTDVNGSWYLIDAMRGFSVGGASNDLNADDTTAEDNNYEAGAHPDGFVISGSGNLGVNTRSYIYIAIRRPMKTPESGTEVFSPYAYSDTGLTSGSGTASNRAIINGGSNGGSGFPVDQFWHQKTSPNSNYGFHIFDRVRGQGQALITADFNASPAGDSASNSGFDFQEGVDVEYNGEMYYFNSNAGNRSHISYCFKRASKAFDIATYTGNGSAGRAVTHNLQAIPEMMFVKAYNTANEAHWVYHKTTGNAASLLVNGDGSGYGGFWNSTTPNDTTFTLSSSAAVNSTSYKYVAWLWATLDGVTKVGSYSGTGSNIDVDCGFSAGARFVLIKRSNGDGDWYVWDSARGIIAGSDPYSIFEGGSSASTDYLDPLASGFTVTSSAPAALNASGGTYIFLAIA